MNKNQTAIVVVAFNRPNSLKRLLQSLSKAKYPENDIPLIISIDFSSHNQEVLELAETFSWLFGTKKIIQHTENLGLREHVLKCGDLTNNYESIIMLEDDLYTSSNFYEYAIEALNFSKNDIAVAGISLYGHVVNVHTNEVFKPIDDGYDNYYFQFASSWGQAWSKLQWNSFKEWYKTNQNLEPLPKIPENVINWSDKSWLKYFTVYLITTNKFFFYPKIALTTNFSDAGTHVGSDSTSYQTPLSYSDKLHSNFSSLEKSHSIYDAFYENLNLYKYLHFSKDDVLIDLYGYKKSTSKRYLLSSRVLNFKVIKSFGCSLKPRDANIISDISGSDFFLYDTSIIQMAENKNNKYRRITYNTGHLSLKNALVLVGKLLPLKIKSKFGV